MRKLLLVLMGLFISTANLFASFAYDTQIGVNISNNAIHYAPIQSLQVSDSALSYLKNGYIQKANIVFSNGSPKGHSLMVCIRYRSNNDDKEMIVTCDQIFYLFDKKFERADRLIPGKDAIMNSEGGKATITSISLELYDFGIHALAINNDDIKDVYSHLVIAEDLIVGDYIIQIHSYELIKDDFNFSNSQ